MKEVDRQLVRVSTFLEKAFVKRVIRRLVMRIVRLFRSTNDVEM